MENDDRLLKAIIDQNANEEEGRKIRQQIKIGFKTGARDKNSHNIVIDASKEVKDILIKTGCTLGGAVARPKTISR